MYDGVVSQTSGGLRAGNFSFFYSTIADHARRRRDALNMWMKSKNPLSWDLNGISGGKYACLSLILCADPGSDRPTLPLSLSHLL